MGSGSSVALNGNMNQHGVVLGYVSADVKVVERLRKRSCHKTTPRTSIYFCHQCESFSCGRPCNVCGKDGEEVDSAGEYFLRCDSSRDDSRSDQLENVMGIIKDFIDHQKEISNSNGQNLYESTRIPTIMITKDAGQGNLGSFCPIQILGTTEEHVFGLDYDYKIFSASDCLICGHDFCRPVEATIILPVQSPRFHASAAPPSWTHSHPICPTCRFDLKEDGGEEKLDEDSLVPFEGEKLFGSYLKAIFAAELFNTINTPYEGAFPVVAVIGHCG